MCRHRQNPMHRCGRRGLPDTQRATADYVHGRGADFAFPVKDNQPGLFDAPGALPWRDIPVSHAAADRAHGRIETRTIQVMDAPGDLPFPHVSQVYLISGMPLPWTARPCRRSPRSA
jgi:hypothetical protein